ncbi:retinal cone rhodopsin-sensitive cGMP 3',5'-cyclic phosphodiesterase subunit gamma isoform X1 [Arvicola amphibius]|uniref:retinal cone rhodopsin-sensitive cGMP 3',5'-cyclic phosphodiesterase subunit gamma isoform X1 n=2 Tax=Arvicola amphibius TaxID=1047088 RepID=UPI0018E299FD|nr:retinal cone rhodopsin-sensitive cGMP 3',5'-cyclic phosphodiesterase subunit gamma isoform X1 [Arvicola amphibius]
MTLDLSVRGDKSGCKDPLVCCGKGYWTTYRDSIQLRELLTRESLKAKHSSYPGTAKMADTTPLGPPAPSQGPITPRKGPPKFKQRQTRQFKSKPPKKGVKGFGDDIPGMEGLGTDITVICPWEAFSHLELHELAQFGII